MHNFGLRCSSPLTKSNGIPDSESYLLRASSTHSVSWAGIVQWSGALQTCVLWPCPLQPISANAYHLHISPTHAMCVAQIVNNYDFKGYASFVYFRVYYNSLNNFKLTVTSRHFLLDALLKLMYKRNPSERTHAHKGNVQTCAYNDSEIALISLSTWNCTDCSVVNFSHL